MINYRRGILVNSLLILMLLALTVFLYRPQADSEPPLPESSEAVSLLQLNVSEIAAVAVKNNRARFGLIHQKGQIFLEPAVTDTRLSQEKMQSFLFRISKLQAEGTLVQPEKPDFYGLDSEDVMITLFLSGGRRERFFLGDRNKLNNSFYLRHESDENIYLIAPEDAEMFLKTPLSFADTSILPRVDLQNLNSVESLSLSFTGGDYPSFRIDNRGSFDFTLTEPVENSVDYEKILTDLIFPVLSLNPERREGLAESDSNPFLNLEITIDKTLYRLSFYGNSTTGFTLTREGMKGVYEVPESEIPFMNLHYLDLLNDSIYHSNISEMQNIIIHDTISGRYYNIDFTGESAEIRGSINGNELSHTETLELFEVLFQTGLARVLSETKERNTNDFLSLQITVQKKKGTIDQLDFVPGNQEEQVLYINGSAGFTTYNNTVYDIIKTLSDLSNEDG